MLSSESNVKCQHFDIKGFSYGNRDQDIYQVMWFLFHPGSFRNDMTVIFEMLWLLSSQERVALLCNEFGCIWASSQTWAHYSLQELTSHFLWKCWKRHTVWQWAGCKVFVTVAEATPSVMALKGGAGVALTVVHFCVPVH